MAPWSIKYGCIYYLFMPTKLDISSAVVYITHVFCLLLRHKDAF